MMTCVFVGFVLGKEECNESKDCKGKIDLCKDSAICVNKVCRCSVSIVGKQDQKCKTAADCPYCPPGLCDKQHCDVTTGKCSCLC